MISLRERFDDYCHDAKNKGCENCQYNDENNSDAIGCAMNFAYQQGRADAIEEYKNDLWEDIEARYKNGIEVLGYLSAGKLLRDVRYSTCYIAEQVKEGKKHDIK